jgi:hypothetical protein
MDHHTASTRLLIRTAHIDAAVLTFARELQAASGHPAALIVDASGAPADATGAVASLSVPGAADGGCPVLLQLSRQACAALQLHCPEDFAWKCGDYGYYLARRQFPGTERFWMFETDVRFYGGDAAEFFSFFDARQDIDFLAAHLRPAGHSWFWRRTARARDAAPFRCLFPVTRLSSRAIDAALQHRVQHGRLRRRRLLWPNDEALVATTLLNGDFVCRDFNDFGREFYRQEIFYHGSPIDGDHFQPDCPQIQLAHPVLFGASYQARTSQGRRIEPPTPWWLRQLQRAALKLNAVSRW